MKFLRLCSILLASALLVACANTPQIRTDLDPQADFSSYRTFAFIEPLATIQAGYTNLLTERLKGAVQIQMQARGYVLNAQSPDLLVNFNTKTQQRTDYVAPPPPPWGGYYYGYRTGFYNSWDGYAGMGPQVIQYVEGILNIDLVDARRRQMVWEGVSTSVINDLQQASSATEIDSVVNAIFAQYPFVAGSGIKQIPKK